MEVFIEDLQGEVERGGDVLVAEAEAVDQGFGVVAVALQAGLLFIEELAGDAVFVVHPQQLALLLFDFVQDALAAVDLLLGGGGAFAEVVADRLAHQFAFCLGDGDRGVVFRDGGFYEVDGLVALGALAMLLAWADEVFVGAAVAFVLGIDQAVPARAAADGALEVVLVDAVALACMVVCLQDGLDLVEEFLAYERLVSSGVALAVVGDDPDVVGAGEHVVDAGDGQRLGGTAPVAARAQAA